jgi:hypothetical protein
MIRGQVLITIDEQGQLKVQASVPAAQAAALCAIAHQWAIQQAAGEIAAGTGPLVVPLPPLR